MLNAFMDMARDTVNDPRSVARRLIDLRLARGTIWTAFAIVVLLSGVLGWIGFTLTPPDPSLPLEMRAQVQPLSLALMQASVLLALAASMAFGGRIFGGTGDFDGALVLTTWLEAMLVALQVVQIVLMLVLPPLALLVGVVGIVLFMWLLTQFIMELHGFESPMKVLGGIIGGFMLAAFLVLLLFGGQMPAVGV